MTAELIARLSTNSKKEAHAIAQEVIDGTISIEVLWELFCGDSGRDRQRISNPLVLLSERAPEALYPLLPQMIELISVHREDDSYARNVLRFWQHIDMPSEYESETYEVAFAYMSDPQEAIAIRVFAMSTCARLAMKYPELSHEIIPVIEEQLPHGSAGYRSRGNKILKQLYKLINTA